MTDFLTSKKTAETLNSSERTLERHRANGTGPVFIKFGRRILYRLEDIEAWVKANTFRSTSDYGARDRS